MAIALTPFEALCGFRPWHEIIGFIEGNLYFGIFCNGTETAEVDWRKSYIKYLSSFEFLTEIKELRDLIGCFGFITEKIETSLLKSYFTALMSQDEEYVKIQSSSWTNKIKTGKFVTFCFL